MPDFTLRKTALVIEDIHHDGGPVSVAPRRRAAILALVKNPFAGGYVEDLQSAMDDLKPLGLMMTDKLIEAMGGVDGIDGEDEVVVAADVLESGVGLDVEALVSDVGVCAESFLGGGEEGG